MPKKDVIARNKESYKDLSDDELINIMHSVVSHAPRHIAAKQEIETRKREFTSKQYKTEKSTNNLTKWILALTIILLIFTAIQLAYSFGAFGSDNIVSINTPSAVQDSKNTKKVDNGK